MKKLFIIVLLLAYLATIPTHAAQDFTKSNDFKETAVTNVKAVSTGTTSIKLTWNKSEGAEGYLIYRQIGKGSYKYRGMVRGNDTTSYTDTSAQTGEYNFYWVFPYRYVNDKMVVGKAAPYKYAMPIPASVTGLKAVSNGLRSVKLSWNAVSNVDGYIIYRQIENGKFEYRYIVSNTGFIDNTAQTGVYNYYRVYPYKMVNGKRIVGKSNQYVYSKPVPKPVTNLKIARNSNRGLTLSWSKSDDVDGYIIYHQNEYEGKFSYLGMTSNLRYNHNNIYDADYHFYRVYAYKNVNGKRLVSGSTTYVYGKANNVSNYNYSVPTKSISLNKAALTMETDTTETLLVNFHPSNTSQNKHVYWSSSDYKIVSVNDKGVLTARRKGTATITVQSVTGFKAQCKVTVVEYPKAGTSNGFKLYTYSSADTVKKLTDNSRNSDGTNTYNIEFFTNGNETWINEAVTFEITDVTPNAYKNMYAQMGYPSKAITYEINSAADRLDYYHSTVLESFTSAGPGQSNVEAKSGKIITVKAGMSTRALKVVAKVNGKIIDTVYVGSTGKDENGEYSKQDEALYKKVRQKVESKLWTSSMSNYDKLSILAAYINKTTHYPNTAAVKKENNPTFWSNWAVDDTLLFYDLCNDVVLNHTMDLQGGITTCYAAQILLRAAEEDLGLKNLYDSQADVVNKGEGVWLALGSYSTNPTNPYHMTLWYKDANERQYGLDAQGLSFSESSSNLPCEMHHCLEQLISLK